MRIHLFLSLSIIFSLFETLIKTTMPFIDWHTIFFCKTMVKEKLFVLCVSLLLGIMSEVYVMLMFFGLLLLICLQALCVCVLLFRSYLVSLVIYLIKHLLGVLFLTSGKRNNLCLHGRSISMKPAILSLIRNYISS